MKAGFAFLVFCGTLFGSGHLLKNQVPQTHPSPHTFHRIANFPLARVRAEGPSAAEIVVGTPDGHQAVYADSIGKGVGFIDIRNPEAPAPLDYLSLDQEPTSLALTEEWVLVVTDDKNSQGTLVVLDFQTHQEVARHKLPGGPDAIAVSPDKRFAAVAIENESPSGFPAAPPGSVAVFRIEGPPSSWELTDITLEGLDCAYPEDPEPEYLAINQDNVAVVSLQENNHIVLIDLERAQIVNHFTAGTVALSQIDLERDKQIRMVDSRAARPREPDGIDWCKLGIVTADEGDLNGGSRSWTLFEPDGTVRWSSGAQTEHIARDLGHYPDRRSPERGTEPEAIKTALYGNEEYVFIGCERSNLVLVYRFEAGTPKYVQALPGGPGPESVTCLPEQGLVLVGAEVDEGEKGPRSYLNIYRLTDGPPPYPSVRSDGISWCALSGLAASPDRPDRLYTLTDKALKPDRILTLDTSSQPARIVAETPLQGSDHNFDFEGVSVASKGGFWLVSEGKVNALLRTDDQGVIIEEIALPVEVESQLKGHGMEGVAEHDGFVFVAFQGLWLSDSEPTGHIGRYDPESREWSFAEYPRDEKWFAAGLTGGAPGELCVLLRDKKARESAVVKRIVRLSLSSFDTGQLSSPGHLDLVDRYKEMGLPVPEKPEGLAFDGEDFWVINDNDAMKDSYGETHLIRLPYSP